MIVNVGTITSSPGDNPSAAIATCRAAVPLLTATPRRRPQYAAQPCSKRSTNSPAEEIQPLLTHSVTYSSSRTPSDGSLTGLTPRNAPSPQPRYTGPA